MNAQKIQNASLVSKTIYEIKRISQFTDNDCVCILLNKLQIVKEFKDFAELLESTQKEAIPLIFAYFTLCTLCDKYNVLCVILRKRTTINASN